MIEYLPRILPGIDDEIAKKIMAIAKKQGLTFRLRTAVKAAKSGRSGVTLTVEPAGGGDAEKLKADVALVAVGRHPATDGLGLEDAGVAMTGRGGSRLIPGSRRRSRISMPSAM